jgi:hypothetical protein
VTRSARVQSKHEIIFLGNLNHLLRGRDYAVPDAFAQPVQS